MEIKVGTKFKMAPNYPPEQFAFVPEFQIAGTEFEILEVRAWPMGNYTGATMIKALNTGNVYHVDQFARYWAFIAENDAKHGFIEIIGEV